MLFVLSSSSVDTTAGSACLISRRYQNCGIVLSDAFVILLQPTTAESWYFTFGSFVFFLLPQHTTVVLWYCSTRRFIISFFQHIITISAPALREGHQTSHCRTAVRVPYSLVFLALLVCYTRLVYVLFMLQRTRIVFYCLLLSQHVIYIYIFSLCFSVEGVSS